MADTKATEVTPGVTSTMRVILLYWVAPLASMLIVGGLVGFFLRFPDSSLIVGAGSGLMLGALGTKAWQAQAEK